MLKEFMCRRHNSHREATLMKTGGAYEKLYFVPVAPVGCYKQFCLFVGIRPSKTFFDVIFVYISPDKQQKYRH